MIQTIRKDYEISAKTINHLTDHRDWKGGVATDDLENSIENFSSGSLFDFLILEKPAETMKQPLKQPASLRKY